MRYMNKTISLDSAFADCYRLAGLDDLQRMGDLLAQYGFQMLVYPNLDKQSVVLTGAQIGAYLAQTWAQEVREKMPISKGQTINYVRRLRAAGMEKLLWRFGMAVKGGRIEMSIGGLADFEHRDQRALVEPFAQRLNELASILYPELFPAFVTVDKLGSDVGLDDVPKRKLKYINWVNIFGPPYVEKYGREFLLGLPGYQSKELPDGAIHHQLTPSFLTTDPKGARVLRQEVVDYCASAGLKVVCKAPYHLPGVSSGQTAASQSSDRELRSYLENMLATTLLLGDGTRVKPVYVQWDRLTDRQRQMALAAIRSAAITEIREHRNSPIRFEFNALPEDLNALMADLVGQDNPDFVYAQVDMDPGHAD